MGIETAIIGGSIVSGLLGARAASKSAKAQQRAAQAGVEARGLATREAIETQQAAAPQIRRDLTEAQRRSASALQFGGRQLANRLSPFSEAGVGALGEQQALLGLGTPEQQQAAFASFQESPGQRFIRERAQKSLLRGASAIGGIGGGNIRSALVEQGAGFAAQDFGNQFNRLGQLRTSGQQAAGQIGLGQLGAAQQKAAGELSTGSQLAQFGQTGAANIGNLLVGQGQAAQQGEFQAGQARASGILGRNQAFQSGLGGILTGAAQGGFFSPSATPPPGQFTQFANFPPQ